MEAKTLQQIIQTLEANHSRQDAYFAIFNIEEEEYESYIEATPDGLKLMALEMLKASQNGPALQDKQTTAQVVNLDTQYIDTEGDVFLEHIRLVLKKPDPAEETFVHESWYDKLIPVGCLAVLLFLLIATLVGIGTIFNWLLS